MSTDGSEALVFSVIPENPIPCGYVIAKRRQRLNMSSLSSAESRVGTVALSSLQPFLLSSSTQARKNAVGLGARPWGEGPQGRDCSSHANLRDVPETCAPPRPRSTTNRCWFSHLSAFPSVPVHTPLRDLTRGLQGILQSTCRDSQGDSPGPALYGYLASGDSLSSPSFSFPTITNNNNHNNT